MKGKEMKKDERKNGREIKMKGRVMQSSAVEGFERWTCFRRPGVQVPPQQIAGIDVGSPELKSSTTSVIYQLVYLWPVEVLNPLSPNSVQDQFSPYNYP